jgi:hypothetical protein
VLAEEGQKVLAKEGQSRGGRMGLVVSCKWHIIPIKVTIFCSELFQGKKRELITRQTKPNNIRDVETPIISLC